MHPAHEDPFLNPTLTQADAMKKANDEHDTWEAAIRLYGLFISQHDREIVLRHWTDVVGAERDRWFRLAKAVRQLRPGDLRSAASTETKPTEPAIPMLLTCPSCSLRHIDEGEFATKPHHTHACQGCGMVWRPAIEPTVGVRFLPGFKNVDPR
jgi:hypothetical protein